MEGKFYRGCGTLKNELVLVKLGAWFFGGTIKLQRTKEISIKKFGGTPPKEGLSGLPIVYFYCIYTWQRIFLLDVVLFCFVQKKPKKNERETSHSFTQHEPQENQSK